MIPLPIVHGLTLCEKVIIEEATRNVTLVNCFTKLAVERFPSPPRQFALHAVLTEGAGEGRIELVITRLDADEVVFRRQVSVQFGDRLGAVRVIFRVGGFSFPAGGRYQFTLLVDGDWLTQMTLRVVARER